MKKTEILADLADFLQDFATFKTTCGSFLKTSLLLLVYTSGRQPVDLGDVPCRSPK